MTEGIWIGVAGIAVVAVLMKVAGPLLGPHELPEPAVRVVAHLAPALLTGLVVADLAGRRWSAFDPALAAGIAAAGLLRWRLGGIVVPVLGAVAVTAGLRLG